MVLRYHCYSAYSLFGISYFLQWPSEHSTVSLSLLSFLSKGMITLPSVLWHCWLGGRKSIRPVKNWVVGVLSWLSVWSEVQTYIWPSWRHCHSLSLASVKSRLVLPFWYQLTRVVPDKGPLNVCACVCVWIKTLYSFCLGPAVTQSLCHVMGKVIQTNTQLYNLIKTEDIDSAFASLSYGEHMNDRCNR